MSLPPFVIPGSVHRKKILGITKNTIYTKGDIMEKKLHLGDENYTYGSYHRIHYKKDMVYTFFQYVDFQAIYNVGMGTFTLKDRLAERLSARGWITGDQLRGYYGAILRFMAGMETFDLWPMEDIYKQICRIRRDVLGEELLEQDWQQRKAEGCEFSLHSMGSSCVGIDQSAKKEELLRKKDALLFVLCQPELYPLMKKDMEAARAAGKHICVKECPYGLDLADVSSEYDALMIYGEEGLLQCRNLKIESLVQAIPFGYHVRTMVNQLDGEYPCVVYIPAHFDITRWVGVTEKTTLSYWQLWQLWKDHGDGIYDLSVEQLYRQYPQYFLNIYENGETCRAAQKDYPICVKWPEKIGPTEGMPGDTMLGETMASYQMLREKAIAGYIGGQPGLTYLSSYFTEDMEQTEIPWGAQTPQSGILVHGVRMAGAAGAKVLQLDTAKPLRQQLKTEQSRGQDLKLFSNFLFFLTPKLAELYNTLRKDRPREQLSGAQGHLDYQLRYEGERRIESFPLYHKAVLAKKKDGRFLLTSYYLGAGQATVKNAFGSQYTLEWGKEHADVLVYTPYYSHGHQEEETNTYRCPIGADRINLVIIQDKICCIRRGDVILPSIGVVISLGEKRGRSFTEALGLREGDEGYYDTEGLELAIELEGPAAIPAEEWQQVEWAYGGGLSLIVEGQSIYGGDTKNTMSEESGLACLAEEGWLSPLSRQTQESALHVLAKHPRTAIGVAKNGDLFVLVFSGRTKLSAGADYQEMCHIAKTLIPDAESMMNVDGGGSSVLGLAIDGEFMELSYPATSIGSCAGMVRRVNTVLCLATEATP